MKKLENLIGKSFRIKDFKKLFTGNVENMIAIPNYYYFEDGFKSGVTYVFSENKVYEIYYNFTNSVETFRHLKEMLRSDDLFIVITDVKLNTDNKLDIELVKNFSANFIITD